MKFSTIVRGRVCREVTFEAESLDAAKELLESGAADFAYVNTYSNFDELELDETEASIQIGALRQLPENPQASSGGSWPLDGGGGGINPPQRPRRR